MPEKCFYDISNVKTQDIAEYPDFFARFYDLIYNNLRTSVDYDYYLKKILECKGSILEIGVGTGRVFVDALRKGADIYGIDFSKTMIDILRTKIEDTFHNRVFIKDAREFNLGVKFDLIVAPFRTFSHFIDTEDQIKVLNNVFSHLNPDGKFIFDVFIPDNNLMMKEQINVLDYEGEYSEGNIFKRYYSMNTDFINQIINTRFSFEWNEGKNYFKKDWETNLRYFHRFELENLIRLSKLRLVNIQGDFNEGSLNKDSKDYIVVCKKDILKL